MIAIGRLYGRHLCVCVFAFW